MQDETNHEFRYLVSLDPAFYVTNWRLFACRDHSVMVLLSIIGSAVGDAAIGSYFGERGSVIFEGKKFVNNDVPFWTYAESIIGSGLAPSEWQDLFTTTYGGYYNFVEEIAIAPATVASDINAKYNMLDPYLVQGKVLYDLDSSYV